ncbi:MAG: hypothetical protein ACK6A7_18465 [Planctomycetota bacterium]
MLTPLYSTITGTGTTHNRTDECISRRSGIIRSYSDALRIRPTNEDWLNEVARASVDRSRPYDGLGSPSHKAGD